MKPDVIKEKLLAVLAKKNMEPFVQALKKKLNWADDNIMSLSGRVIDDICTDPKENVIAYIQILKVSLETCFENISQVEKRMEIWDESLKILALILQLSLAPDALDKFKKFVYGLDKNHNLFFYHKDIANIAFNSFVSGGTEPTVERFNAASSGNDFESDLSLEGGFYRDENKDINKRVHDIKDFLWRKALPHYAVPKSFDAELDQTLDDSLLYKMETGDPKFLSIIKGDKGNPLNGEYGEKLIEMLKNDLHNFCVIYLRDGEESIVTPAQSRLVAYIRGFFEVKSKVGNDVNQKRHADPAGNAEMIPGKSVPEIKVGDVQGDVSIVFGHSQNSKTVNNFNLNNAADKDQLIKLINALKHELSSSRNMLGDANFSNENKGKLFSEASGNLDDLENLKNTADNAKSKSEQKTLLDKISKVVSRTSTIMEKIKSGSDQAAQAYNAANDVIDNIIKLIGVG